MNLTGEIIVIFWISYSLKQVFFNLVPYPKFTVNTALKVKIA